MTLNRREIQPATLNSYAGAWCVYNDMIVFSAFYSNVLFVTGSQGVAMAYVERTHWLDRGTSNPFLQRASTKPR